MTRQSDSTYEPVKNINQIDCKKGYDQRNEEIPPDAQDVENREDDSERQSGRKKSSKTIRARGMRIIAHLKQGTKSNWFGGKHSILIILAISLRDDRAKSGQTGKPNLT